VAMLSVVHREDLGPIERARAYQKMLDVGDYADQKELAAAMGVDQSTISNLVRLLKLPENWQSRIISREISERHARAMLPYAKYPAIAEGFERFFALYLDSDNSLGMPSVIEWEGDTVPQIVKDATRSMDGMDGDRMYYHPRYGRVSIFEPDAFQEKQLGIIKLGDEQLATNVELWDELQEAHIKAEADKLSNDQGATVALIAGDDAGDEEVAAVAEKWDRPQAEELAEKLLDVYDRHLRSEIKLARNGVELCQEIQRVGYIGLLDDLSRDKALDIVEEYRKADSPAPSPKPPVPSSAPLAGENALRRWLLSWAQWLIADEIRQRTDTNTLLGMLMLGMHVWGFEVNELELDEICADKLEPNRKKTLSERLLNADIYHTEQVAGQVVANWFFIEDRGPMFLLDGEEIKRVVDAMAIDLEGEFQAGNVLTPNALLNLLDEATLHSWGKAWKVEMSVTMKWAKLIEILATALQDGRTMPAELKTAWKQIGKKFS